LGRGSFDPGACYRQAKRESSRARLDVLKRCLGCGRHDNGTALARINLCRVRLGYRDELLGLHPVENVINEFA
jgi:hypothetical protein